MRSDIHPARADEDLDERIAALEVRRVDEVLIGALRPHVADAAGPLHGQRRSSPTSSVRRDEAVLSGASSLRLEAAVGSWPWRSITVSAFGKYHDPQNVVANPQLRRTRSSDIIRSQLHFSTTCAALMCA